MIDIRKLKELVRLMVTNDLSELDLRDEQQQVTVKRGGNQAQPVIQQVAPAVAAPAAAPAAVAPPAAAAPEPAADDGLVPIESPMVGTFYAKPNPEKPNFVSVGDSIGPDSVVCLIEAMKIFNEIKAERSGTVVKVLVENGDAVEFGQPMLLIKPE
ncbi:MAG: acetyl-CoA carboxylase biotin carboxyl carrier protein [Phycisphaerales bacterium]|nr:acetyl-CoA carboxylase biotin carboxyl carrier protein [Phycisphaerales bacterium]